MEEQLEIRVINGNFVKDKDVIARCHCQVHRGYLSKSLVRSHQCISKKCSFFEKLKPEYWEAVETERKEQKARKQRLKQAVRMKEERDLLIKETLQASGCVHVTSIREKTPNVLTITYIYDLRPDLSSEVSFLRRECKKRIVLCARGGTVETIEQLIKMPRRETRIVTDVRKAPNVGSVTKKRLDALGVYCLEDLYGRTANALYALDCKRSGKTVNRRYLAAYQSAISFAHVMGIRKQCLPTGVFES